MLNTLAIMVFTSITLGVTIPQIESPQNNTIRCVYTEVDNRIESDHPQYLINQSTSKKELETIREAAVKAGINFEYHPTYKKGKLRKVDLFFSLNTSSETSSCSHTIYIKKYKVKKEGITINWIIDESGKAIDFYLE